jgi:uncharacterized protein (TIGR00106 family)
MRSVPQTSTTSPSTDALDPTEAVSTSAARRSVAPVVSTRSVNRRTASLSVVSPRVAAAVSANTSNGSRETNAWYAMLPARNGSCSARTSRSTARPMSTALSSRRDIPRAGVDAPKTFAADGKTFAADGTKCYAGQQFRMTVIALLSVAPVTEDSMAADVADAVAALDDFDVAYETNPMGTVVEAEDIDTLLDAVAAAHKTVDADRVSTVLKVDDKRDTDERATEKVDAVERELGREARSGFE